MLNSILINTFIGVFFTNLCINYVYIKILNYKDISNIKSVVMLLTNIFITLLYIIFKNNINITFAILICYLLYSMIFSIIINMKYLYSIILTIISLAISFILYIILYIQLLFKIWFQVLFNSF